MRHASVEICATPDSPFTEQTTTVGPCTRTLPRTTAPSPLELRHPRLDGQHHRRAGRGRLCQLRNVRRQGLDRPRDQCRPGPPHRRRLRGQEGRCAAVQCQLLLLAVYPDNYIEVAASATDRSHLLPHAPDELRQRLRQRLQADGRRGDRQPPGRSARRRRASSAIDGTKFGDTIVLNDAGSATPTATTAATAVDRRRRRRPDVRRQRQRFPLWRAARRTTSTATTARTALRRRRQRRRSMAAPARTPPMAARRRGLDSTASGRTTASTATTTRTGSTAATTTTNLTAAAARTSSTAATDKDDSTATSTTTTSTAPGGQRPALWRHRPGRAYGGGGNDRLYGDADNDTIYGGSGNDKRLWRHRPGHDPWRRRQRQALWRRRQ